MIPRLFAATLLVLAFGTVSMNAQTKKDGKEPQGSVEIYKNKEGEYRYRVKNNEGKTIAMPLPQMSWATKGEVLKAIQDLKTILNTPPIEVKDGLDNKTKAETKTETKKTEKTEKKTTDKK